MQAVERGHFRNDLYCRLSVNHVHVLGILRML
ncbi:hypothetical protein [Desulfovibrio sp. MES5]